MSIKNMPAGYSLSKLALFKTGYLHPVENMTYKLYPEEQEIDDKKSLLKISIDCSLYGLFQNYVKPKYTYTPVFLYLEPDIITYTPVLYIET